MLYVFNVDLGTMITFEMTMALESVNQLKGAIAQKCGIPVDKQVLLVSGGEGLDLNARVCSFSAGTDTNPIFLFSLVHIDKKTPPVLPPDLNQVPDLEAEVNAALDLPPSIQTVNLRSNLAKRMCDMAVRQHTALEQIVYEQHLQHQGWAAVVANLDDCTKDFKKRAAVYDAYFKQYLENREEYQFMLKSCSEVKEILMKIPILGVLRPKFGEEEGSDARTAIMLREEELSGSQEQAGPTEGSTCMSLLQWVEAKDGEHTFDSLVTLCQTGLEQMNEKTYEQLKAEVKSTLDLDIKVFKEIKGLEGWLGRLEELRHDAKKLVNEQTELAQAFAQNQDRARNLGDTSILPDLCASHKKQLVVMLQNHQKLKEIRNKCYKSKQDLIHNIHHRLEYITYFERKISETEREQLLFHEGLKRLRSMLAVLQQIHRAPNLYLQAVLEVLRRRTFSQAFLMWANDISCQLCAIHSEEVAKRKRFQADFDGHFLASLFPGFEDSPPPFATEPPTNFDMHLPKLCVTDVEQLKKGLPSLSLSLPDTASFAQFFLTRSVTQLRPDQPSQAASFEDRIVQAVSAAGLSSNLDPALLQPAESVSMAQSATTTTQPISSDRGFESETDTEEFEKVGQSPCELRPLPLPNRLSLHDRENEIKDLLKTRLEKINGIVNEALSDLKSDFSQLKARFLTEKSLMDSVLSQLHEAWLQQKHALHLELKRKEEALSEMCLYKDNLEKEVQLSLQREEVERRNRLEAEKRLSASAVPLVSTSQERLERSNPEEVLRRVMMERERDRGQETSAERGHWDTLEYIMAQSKFWAEAEKKVFAEISEGPLRMRPEKRLDRFHSLDHSASQDLLMYRESVRNEGLGSKRTVSECAASLQFAHNVSPSASILTIESQASCRRDAATSPEPTLPLRRTPRTHRTSQCSSGKCSSEEYSVNLQSCNEGDSVLVVWDGPCGAYIVAQDSSPHVYFLHHDSLSPLGLTGSQPRRRFTVGEVVNKEYCQAKKSENRYNVKVGTKFYRVKVRPPLTERKQSGASSAAVPGSGASSAAVPGSGASVASSSTNT